MGDRLHLRFFLDQPTYIGRKRQPIHVRGVTKRTGLFFLGLRRTYSLGSALVAGAVNDAAYIADRIAALERVG